MPHKTKVLNLFSLMCVRSVLYFPMENIALELVLLLYITVATHSCTMGYCTRCSTLTSTKSQCLYIWLTRNMQAVVLRRLSHSVLCGWNVLPIKSEQSRTWLTSHSVTAHASLNRTAHSCTSCNLYQLLIVLLPQIALTAMLLMILIMKSDSCYDQHKCDIQCLW